MSAVETIARFGRLLATVAEEARRNPAFAERIEQALGMAEPKPASKSAPPRPAPKRARAQKPTPPPPEPPAAPPRAAPVLDPFSVYDMGWEALLRERLAPLDLEKLKDIVEHHALDPSGQAMSSSDPEGVRERIVEAVVEKASEL